jgi:hypothetical protein
MTAQPSPYNRSRITNGRRLLPGVHAQSAWARIMRDVVNALAAHCGGESNLIEPQRLIARRAAIGSRACPP